MILISRQDIEARELQTLAPYAARSAESRGRVYAQEQHPLRTVFQRDRDRIVHSAAFRRMEYKTQVFIPHLADHYRTRLTHTIEVAQISRTLARNLRLNEDLTEAIALVHDVGHTPFGHSGEDVLNELLASHGGFNHNRQSLRVVDLLEQRYPGHPGLNLSYEVREGIAKHETKGGIVNDQFVPEERPTLEASLVDKADELTYSAHDIDDGLSSGLISIHDLEHLSVWDHEQSPLAGDGLETAAGGDEMRYRLVRFLINLLATDLLEATEARLQKLRISNLASLRAADESLCDYSEPVAARLTELKQFLFDELYHHRRLLALAERAGGIVRMLYRKLVDDPGLMPVRFQTMLATEAIEIVAADYLAGMTDRFAERLAKELA